MVDDSAALRELERLLAARLLALCSDRDAKKLRETVCPERLGTLEQCNLVGEQGTVHAPTLRTVDMARLARWPVLTPALKTRIGPLR
jgi:hypothetical protein